MTPVDTGAPAGSGGLDISGGSASAIDSLLDAPDIQESSPAEAEPEAEEQAEPEQAEDTGEYDDLPSEEDSEIDPESIDLEGRNHYRVPPSRMKTFVQAKNFQNAIADIAPTVEAVQQLHQSASDFRAMQIEFQAGTPEAAGKFLEFWAGSPEGIGAVTQQLPVYLAERAQAGDQQALRTLTNLETMVHAADINRLYDQAAKTGDATDLWKAQMQDYLRNGKHRYETVQAIPRQDPAQVQRQQQQQREQALNARENQQIQNQWQSFDKQYLNGAKETSLQQEIEKAFAVVKGKYPEGVLSALKREAQAKVAEGLKSSFEWNRNHNLEAGDIQRDFANSLRANRPTKDVEPRANALVNDYRARAARLLPGIVKPLIAGQTERIVAESKATHQKLAAGAAKSAPGGSGRPAPRSITDRTNWKTASEGLEALLG